MNCKIRKIKENEQALLDDFLYEAIFIPEGVTPPDRSIIEHPDLQLYVRNFGAYDDDHALLAEVDGTVVHKALYKARRRRQCVFVQQGNAVQTLRE